MTAIPAAPTPGAALPAVTARVDVVSIQSQVVYGCVGNNAAMPIFRQAGLRAIALPTVILSNTPHYPTLHGGAVPLDWFEGLLRGLDERGVTRVARAVVCGYLGQPGQADLLAQWLPALRAARPDLRVHIDPVMGDRNDGLYVEAGRRLHRRRHLARLERLDHRTHFRRQLRQRHIADVAALGAGGGVLRIALGERGEIGLGRLGALDQVLRLLARGGHGIAVAHCGGQEDLADAVHRRLRQLRLGALVGGLQVGLARIVVGRAADRIQVGLQHDAFLRGLEGALELGTVLPALRAGLLDQRLFGQAAAQPLIERGAVALELGAGLGRQRLDLAHQFVTVHLHRAQGGHGGTLGVGRRGRRGLRGRGASLGGRGRGLGRRGRRLAALGRIAAHQRHSAGQHRDQQHRRRQPQPGGLVGKNLHGRNLACLNAPFAGNGGRVGDVAVPNARPRAWRMDQFAASVAASSCGCAASAPASSAPASAVALARRNSRNSCSRRSHNSAVARR